ncbi:sigma-70 family RNA polymerase sigma factor [uncultured Chitinophaga sp.]|jgi:RNA polymerase sigma factor, sigma-70 family|uniref:RNA polymerase sigma factor n=1 Tax=uncultured Chitinophaga sp. TaxID=339340 RepID=UPI0026390160|nr:sigma-70 family RNA polymerase sigma factor [uncultured Chitinophaga sp.]
MQPKSDAYLLAQLKAGDEAAFTELFNKYRSVLYMEAYYRLKDHQEAQDIVQNIFTWIWMHRSAIPAEITFRQYLFRAVRNKCIDKHRKSKTVMHFIREYGYAKESGTNQVPLETKELSQQLTNAINAISAPASRKAFQLLYQEGKSHKTIALEMGINVQTVKNQISRALKVLRGKLKSA